MYKRENPEESLQLQGEALSGVRALGAAREKRAGVRHGAGGGCCPHAEASRPGGHVDPAAWTPRAPLSSGMKTGPAEWGGCILSPQVHLLELRCHASGRSRFFHQRISKDRAARSLSF